SRTSPRPPPYSSTAAPGRAGSDTQITVGPAAAGNTAIRRLTNETPQPSITGCTPPPFLIATSTKRTLPNDLRWRSGRSLFAGRDKKGLPQRPRPADPVPRGRNKPSASETPFQGGPSEEAQVRELRVEVSIKTPQNDSEVLDE